MTDLKDLALSDAYLLGFGHECERNKKQLIGNRLSGITIFVGGSMHLFLARFLDLGIMN